ncbi:DUF4118 domain-containing protein [Streptacidiphilus sp. 4-A2]|nr:DUF4118 domain-containing protein [Streptacidiphilus sp. 4-A2]
MTALHWHRDRFALISALLAPPAVAALLVPFRSPLPAADAALVLVVVVVAVAANGHRAAGILAALSAAVWFDFFLTAPYYRFAINGRDNIETAVLLLVVGIAVTEIAHRGRRMHGIAVTGGAQAGGVRHTAELVASDAPVETVLEQVGAQLTGLLALRGCRFVQELEPDTYPPVLRPDGSLRWGATLWDVERLGLPSDEIELPTRFQGRPLGRFMLLPTPATAPPIGARQTAVVLADLVGARLSGTEQPSAGPAAGGPNGGAPTGSAPNGSDRPSADLAA